MYRLVLIVMASYTLGMATGTLWGFVLLFSMLWVEQIITEVMGEED